MGTKSMNESLKKIREIIDMPVADDLDSILGKGEALNGVIGLSAELKSRAKANLELARAKAIHEVDNSLPASIMSKAIDSKCAKELATYEYADRLNAAITHQIDYLRSVISLKKSEMENERFNN